MTRPGNEPYASPFSDGYQLTIKIKKELHDRMLEDMLSTSENRTVWIRRAIEERLEKRGKK